MYFFEENIMVLLNIAFDMSFEVILTIFMLGYCFDFKIFEIDFLSIFSQILVNFRSILCNFLSRMLWIY